MICRLFTMSISISRDNNWYCRVFNTELGPLTFEAVRRMVEMEQLGGDDHVRCGTTDSWHAVRHVADLRKLLKGIDSQEEKPSPAPNHPPQSVEPPDEWHYRLDGREHGPITLGALRDLISASGEIAYDVVIRQGVNGAWVSSLSLLGSGRDRGQSIRQDGDLSAAAEQREHRSDAAVHSQSFNNRKYSPLNVIRNNSDVAIGVAAWVLFNLVVLIAWPQPYSTERQYFALLRGLEAEVKAMQSRDASPEEWVSFRKDAKETLKPVVNDLKKSASVLEPIRQHLLWAARDQLPRLIGPRSSEMKEPERIYEQHMHFVEQEFNRH